MATEICDASPKAIEIREAFEAREKQLDKYPFGELDVGKSFVIDTEECNWKSLRSMVYQMNKRCIDSTGELIKVFEFIKHDNPAVCEVSRIK